MQRINGNDAVQTMLDSFSADLRNGKYTKKLEYDIWRHFKKAIQIAINFNNNNINVQASLPNNIAYNSWFSCNDCGFGQFLMDNYLKEEKTVGEETKLTYNNDGLHIKVEGNTWEPLTGVASTTTNETITYTTSGDWLNGSTINAGTIWTYPSVTVTVNGERFVTKEEFYKEKEEDNMDTKKIFGSSFDFGPCGDTVRMSMYGLAVKNQNGEWVSYDTTSGEIINVEVFNFAEGGKWFYKMPVAVDDVAVGNLIIHAKKPCYVVGFSENTLNPIVVDIYNMEQKEILLQKNMFGFNYATKVVSPFNGLDMQQPTAKNPFGNMWMFALMGDGKSDDMLPLMMMMQGGCGNMNPMLMYMMMSKEDSKIDPFMLMMLNGGMNMCGENK